MRQTICLIAGLLFVCTCLFSQDPNADSKQRMRQLEDWTKSADTDKQPSQSNQGTLLKGPDDDPTTAADYIEHEALPAAKKAAERAERLSRKGQHDKAIAEFQHALEIDPQYYEAANNLGLEYFDAGQTELAIQQLKHLTETEPKLVLAFDNLAIILCNLARYKEAEAYATHAYRAHPFSYKAAYVYGSALVNQGKKTPEAKQALRYASERHAEASRLLANWPNS